MKGDRSKLADLLRTGLRDRRLDSCSLCGRQADTGKVNIPSHPSGRPLATYRYYHLALPAGLKTRKMNEVTLWHIINY